MNYMDILFFFFRNEFPIQLFISLLLFVPWKRGRSHLAIRLLIMFAVLFSFYLFAPVPRPLIFMVQYFMLIIAVPLLFKCNFWESLFFSTNAYCIQNIISGTSYALLWRNILPLDFPYDYYVMTIAITLVVYALVYLLYTRRYAALDQFRVHNLAAILVSAMVSIFAIFFVTFCLEEEFTFSSQSNYRVLTAMISFLCLLVNVSNCQNKTMETENKILRLLLQKDEQQYEQAKRSMEKVNIKYHDLKKAQSSESYVQSNIQLCDATNVDDINYGFMTGNKTLDIILFEKNALCRQKGIRFVCEADGSAIDHIKPYHLYSIFGNAIDNAIESLETLEDDSKKEMFVSVIRRGNIAIIKFYNYTQNVLKTKDGFPVTTKQDVNDHGYGIKSIFSVVEVYGGSANYFIENGIFYLVITLPIE